jgi:hypothetical protein
MGRPNFTKRVVGEVANDVPPAQMNTFSAVADVNCDGLPDIVVCGRNGRMVWLENRGEGAAFPLHLVDDVTAMECGGSLVDLTGDGLLDIINGSDWRGTEIFWWQNPGAAGGKWKRRLIANTRQSQFHDTIVGDVTGDGTRSLVFTNQHGPGGTTLYRVPLPKDPAESPWPGLEAMAAGKSEKNVGTGGRQPEEGVAIGDVDGDGKPEVVSGTHWYKYVGSGKPWEAHQFAAGYITTKIAVGDLDGDGRQEIVLAEGDPCVYGRPKGGKVGWFKPKGDAAAMWEERVLEDGLLDAHSLQVGDILGSGRLDILVGEVGVGGANDAYAVRPPRLLVFANEGEGRFTRHVVDEGTGIHDAVLVDMRRKGVLDIVGKPLHGPEKWKVHVYYNNRCA